jgi:hypothetical protein
MEAKNVRKVVLQGSPEVFCAVAFDECVEEGEVAERLHNLLISI